MNGGLPFVDPRQRALDGVERGHVTPVMVTFPAVSRTVSCTVRAEPSAMLAWQVSWSPGSHDEHRRGPARGRRRERRVGDDELLDRRPRQHGLGVLEGDRAATVGLGRVEHEEGARQLHGAREARAALAGHAVGTRHVAEGEPLVAGSHLACDLTPGRTGVERGRVRGTADEHERHRDDRSEQRPAHRWRLNDALTYSAAVTSEGQTVVTRAQPVPAAPPSAGDVLRHGANVGFGALGLARRAMGTVFARIQPTERRSPLTPPSTLDLVPGALAGLALVTERRVRSVVVGVASGTASTARVVDATGRRPARAAAARRPALELERGRTARAGAQSRRGIGGAPDARAAGHRERHRAARLRRASSTRSPSRTSWATWTSKRSFAASISPVSCVSRPSRSRAKPSTRSASRG